MYGLLTYKLLELKSGNRGISKHGLGYPALPLLFTSRESHESLPGRLQALRPPLRVLGYNFTY